MKIIYECELCRKQFSDKHQCIIHELSHLNGDNTIKYYIQNVLGEDICKHCDNAYYVYGCELDCKYKNCDSKNNYEHFKLEGV